MLGSVLVSAAAMAVALFGPLVLAPRDTRRKLTGSRVYTWRPRPSLSSAPSGLVRYWPGSVVTRAETAASAK